MNERLRHALQILRYLHRSVFFNFKHLPFRQAIKIPILLYKPRLLNNTGSYQIKDKISFGMIRLGFPIVSIYPDLGITLENKGKIEFKGNCRIGNGCAISIGEKGCLDINENFTATAGLKIACYNKINIGKEVLVGWDVLIMDTDFHAMKMIETGSKKKGYGSVIIGNNIWIAAFCKIYKNSLIPDWCTVASNTIINNKIKCSPYSLIYNPITLETKYISSYRDSADDAIEYM